MTHPNVLFSISDGSLFRMNKGSTRQLAPAAITTHHSWKERHIQKLTGKPSDTGYAVKWSLRSSDHFLWKKKKKNACNKNEATTFISQIITWQSIKKTVFGLCASNPQLSVSWSLFPSFCVYSSMSIVCLSFGTSFYSVSTKPLSTQHNLNFLACRHLKSCYFCSFKKVSSCRVL